MLVCSISLIITIKKIFFVNTAPHTTTKTTVRLDVKIITLRSSHSHSLQTHGGYREMQRKLIGSSKYFISVEYGALW